MTMDFEENANLYITTSFSKKQKKEQRKKTWVNHVMNQRLLKDQFHKLYEDLCACPKKYNYWLFSDA